MSNFFKLLLIFPSAMALASSTASAVDVKREMAESLSMLDAFAGSAKSSTREGEEILAESERRKRARPTAVSKRTRTMVGEV